MNSVREDMESNPENNRKIPYTELLMSISEMTVSGKKISMRRSLREVVWDIFLSNDEGCGRIFFHFFLLQLPSLGERGWGCPYPELFFKKPLGQARGKVMCTFMVWFSCSKNFLRLLMPVRRIYQVPWIWLRCDIDNNNPPKDKMYNLLRSQEEPCWVRPDQISI